MRRILGIPQKITSNGMNPMDFWYATKLYLKDYMDNYLTGKDMKKLIFGYYTSGSTLEKTQTLTVLESIKYYFV